MKFRPALLLAVLLGLILGFVGGSALAATGAFAPPCTSSSNSCLNQRMTAVEAWVQAHDTAPAPPPSTTSATSTTSTAPPTSTTTTPATSTTTSASSTTTATPPPSSTTTAPAPAGAFPDASNTGPTKALNALPRSVSFTGWKTDSAGNINITGPGAVIDGYDIPGAVYNNGFPFTLRQSWVRCIGENSWCVDMGAGGSLVEDTIIGGGDPAHPYNMAIGILSYQGAGAQNRVLRTEIHHLMHGVRADGNFYLADSYLHDFPMGDPTWDYNRSTNRTDLHSDATMTQGAERVEAQHNTLWGGNTSGFFVQPDVGNTTSTVKTVVVNDNLFVSTTRNGQMPTWGVLIEAKPVNGTSRTLGPVTVTNNVFTRGNWQGGPMSIQVPATISGNAYDDGTPIN